LRLVSGSWKIAPIWRPRILRSSSYAQLLVWQAVDAPAFEQDLAARDPPRRLEQADDRRPGQRLAGAGLADHPQHLAGRDRERDVVHRAQRAAARRKLDLEIANFKQRRTHDSPETGRSGGTGQPSRPPLTAAAD